jgi:hypothetical protein
MEEYELKDLIGKQRLNYTHLKTVLDFFVVNPGVTGAEAAIHTGLGSNVYRYRDILIQAGLINKHNIPKKGMTTRIDKYIFPADVLNGNNSVGNSIVNLAATLVRFGDNDTIPGFDMTRAQIVESINTKFLTDERLGNALEEMKKQLLSTLAMLALVANELEAFRDMTNVKPVTKDEIKDFLV